MRFTVGIVGCVGTIVLFDGIFYFVYKTNDENYTKWMNCFFQTYMITTPLVFGYFLSLIYCVFCRGFNIKSFNYLLIHMFNNYKLWFFGLLLNIEHTFIIIYPISKYALMKFGNGTSFDQFAKSWSAQWMMTLYLWIFFGYFFGMINIITYCFDPNAHHCGSYPYNHNVYLCLFMQFPFKCFSLGASWGFVYQVTCFVDWDVTNSSYYCRTVEDPSFVGFTDETTHTIIIWMYVTFAIISLTFIICLHKKYSQMFNHSVNHIVGIASIEKSIIFYLQQLEYNERLSINNNTEKQLNYVNIQDNDKDANCCKSDICSIMRYKCNVVKARTGIPLSYIIVALNGLITSTGALYQYFVFNNKIHKMKKTDDYDHDSLQLDKQQRQYCMLVCCVSALTMVVALHSVLLKKIKKIKNMCNGSNNIINNNNNSFNNNNKSNINTGNIDYMLSDSLNRRLILSLKFLLLIAKPYLIVVADDESRALIFEFLQCMTLIVVSYLTFSRLYLNFQDTSCSILYHQSKQKKYTNTCVYDSELIGAERNNTDCSSLDAKTRSALTLHRDHSMSSNVGFDVDKDDMENVNKIADNSNDTSVDMGVNDDIVNICQNVTIKIGYWRMFAISYLFSYFISTLCFYFCFAIIVVKRKEIWNPDGNFQWDGNLLAFAQYFWLYLAKLYHNEVVIFGKTKNRLDLIVNNQNNCNDFWFADHDTITKTMLTKYQIFAQSRLDNVVFWLVLLTLFSMGICGLWIYSYLVIIKDKIGDDMASAYLIQFVFCALITTNSFVALCCFEFRKHDTYTKN